jgi:hypothetical protein
MYIQEASNMQLKSFLRLRLRHSDVATCHANRDAISAPEHLRRLTECYVPRHNFLSQL